MGYHDIIKNPWYVDRYNNSPESLASRLETMVWTPTLPMEKYNAFPYVLDDLPFRYTFSEKFANCYPNLKTSPFINKEINRWPQFLGVRRGLVPPVARICCLSY